MNRDLAIGLPPLVTLLFGIIREMARKRNRSDILWGYINVITTLVSASIMGLYTREYPFEEIQVWFVLSWIIPSVTAISILLYIGKDPYEEIQIERKRNEKRLRRMRQLEMRSNKPKNKAEVAIEREIEARRKEESREKRQQYLLDNGIGALIYNERLMSEAFTRKMLRGNEAYISFLGYCAEQIGLEDIEWTDQTINDIEQILRRQDPLPSSKAKSSHKARK